MITSFYLQLKPPIVVKLDKSALQIGFPRHKTTWLNTLYHNYIHLLPTLYITLSGALTSVHVEVHVSVFVMFST